MAAVKSEPPRPSVVVAPCAVGGDEASHHRYFFRVHQRFQPRDRAVIGLVEDGNGVAVIAVGENAFARIHQARRDVARAESRRDDLARDALAERGHVVGGPRRQLAHGREPAQQLVQAVELRFQLGMELGEDPGPQQLAGHGVMPLAQGARELDGLLAVAGAGGARHRQKLVGDLGQRAHHYHRHFRHALAHDARRAVDGGGVLHRRAAKFHHDHGRGSLVNLGIPAPSAVRHSAAPRPRPRGWCCARAR